MTFHLITDCDGILTSPILSYTKEGKTIKQFGVNDSLTLKLVRDIGLFKSITVLTGDEGPGLEITKTRLAELDLSPTFCKNVGKYYWIKERFNLDEVVYFGDDIFDLPTLNQCYFGGTVISAPNVVKQYASCVSTFEGGRGAFTDLIFSFMVGQGIYPEDAIFEYIEKQHKKENWYGQ